MGLRMRQSLSIGDKKSGSNDYTDISYAWKRWYNKRPKSIYFLNSAVFPDSFTFFAIAQMTNRIAFCPSPSKKGMKNDETSFAFCIS